MNWKYKIKLNPLIIGLSEKYDLSCEEEPCPEEVKLLLSQEVEKAIPIARFGNKIKKCVTIAEVNSVIDDVYDIADRESIWCGL